jgi:hypothetical protein
MPEQNQKQTQKPPKNTPEHKTNNKKIILIFILLGIFLLIGIAATFGIYKIIKSVNEKADNTLPFNELACTYNNRRYELDETFDSTDGCNTCTCTDGQVICTLIDCNTSEDTTDTIDLDESNFTKVNCIDDLYTNNYYPNLKLYCFSWNVFVKEEDNDVTTIMLIKGNYKLVYSFWLGLMGSESFCYSKDRINSYTRLDQKWVRLKDKEYTNYTYYYDNLFDTDYKPEEMEKIYKAFNPKLMKEFEDYQACGYNAIPVATNVPTPPEMDYSSDTLFADLSMNLYINGNEDPILTQEADNIVINSDF